MTHPQHIIILLVFTLFCMGQNGYAQDLPQELPVEESTGIPELLELPDSLQLVPYILEVKEPPASARKTAQAPAPAPPAKFFSGIDISFDYLKLAGLALDFETKYEGGLNLIFLNRFSLSLEAGSAVLTPERAYKNGVYEAKGEYGRIGLDYIFSFEDNTAIFVGGRYGKSRFSEHAVFQIGNVFGQQEDLELIDRDNLHAYWYEFILGTETSVFRNLYAGGMVRFRILGGRDRFEDFDVYSIPGYGRGFDNTLPAFNLFIKYKFRL